MRTPNLFATLAILCAGLGWSGDVQAHRLDEFLQAARVSIERDRIDLEIDLTAGVSVAPLVFSRIDANRDGRVSAVEGADYAQQVFRSIELRIDNVPVVLTVAARQFPEFDEMNAGVGVIRLRGAASFPALAKGKHQVFFRNTHQPEFSVYLANALVPTDKQIEITGQDRDSEQHELKIDFRVVPASFWGSAWELFIGLTLAGAISFAFKGRSRRQLRQ